METGILLEKKLRGLEILGQEVFDSDPGYSAYNNPYVIAWWGIKIFLSLFGILVLIAFVYGGWMYTTSKGNEEKTKKALKIIGPGTIGALIILASFAITYFLLGIYAEVTDNRYYQGDQTIYIE